MKKALASGDERGEDGKTVEREREKERGEESKERGEGAGSGFSMENSIKSEEFG